MAPGDFVDSIKRFAGYLHMPPSAMRLWSGAFEAGPRPPVSAEPAGRDSASHAADHPPPVLSADGLPHRLAGSIPAAPATPAAPAFHVVGHAPLPHVRDGLQGGHAPPFMHPDHACSAPPSWGSVVDDGVGATQTPPKPDQAIVAVAQANALTNDNTVAPTSDEATRPGAGHDLPARLADAARLAAADPLLPDAGANATDTVASHDAALAAGRASAGTVAAGTYLDGHVASAASVLPSGPVGAAIVTGGDTGSNVAAIVDDHAQRTGLVVMGSAYTTQAIVQTNLLLDHHQAAASDLDGHVQLSVGASTTGNLASFGSITGVTTGSVFPASSAQVHVDTIAGDYYDVSTLSQTNSLIDNDLVRQTTTSASFGEVITGGNAQYNVASLATLNGRYDLIVVGGSLHEATVIDQRNVLVSDAAVHLSGTGSATLTAGGNVLSNTATIDHIGATQYQALTPAVSSAVSHLLDGKADPSLALLPGSGGLNVLYITGDLFEVNLVRQTNLVSNVGAIDVTMHDASAAVTTGGNLLSNVARVTTVGTLSAFQFVGGQHYDDAFLVQTNLLASSAGPGHAGAGAAGPSILAGIADAAQAAHGLLGKAALGDAGHHDLFHGVTG